MDGYFIQLAGQWAGIGILGGTMAIMMRRNGQRQHDYEIDLAKQQAERDATIVERVDEMKNDLRDNTKAVNKITDGMADFREHCATTSTALSGRVTALENKKRRR